MKYYMLRKKGKGMMVASGEGEESLFFFFFFFFFLRFPYYVNFVPSAFVVIKHPQNV